MIAGLSPAPADRIWLGAKSLHHYTSGQLRKYMALFTPEAPLLGNTLAGVLGNPSGKKEAYARELLAHFGMPVPEKQSLKIEIGTDGERLSSGEAAILQLIRMLIRPRPLMLFDDPFCRLDGKARQQLISLLDRLSEQHAILLALREAEDGGPKMHSIYLRKEELIYH
jgi:ABC-type transport system involved in cytochrome bd biosynthesis fused ATPase/permease subunit